MNKFSTYLDVVGRPHQKLCKIEFLQPDGSVAFALGTSKSPVYNNTFNSKAFIKEGALNVNLQNGERRKATITLSDLDNAFDYAVNHIWFGQQLRLSMGIVLPDGTDFYFPKGVFYIDAPTTDYTPGNRTATFNLVDKWNYLNGNLFGSLDTSHVIYAKNGGGESINVFEAMASVLKWSRKDFNETTDKLMQIDPTAPVFTTYYDGKTYQTDSGETVNVLDLPYDITVSGDDTTIEDILFSLNAVINGWIGYDCTGALRVDASQDDILDSDKPVQWTFTEDNATLSGLSETAKTADVKNDVLIIGAGLTGSEIYGRAYNDDPASDTCISRIGRRTHVETRAEYWNTEQCIAYAKFLLKRKTILQKEISIECSQLYHIEENNVVVVQRKDKEGAPFEKHLVQSYSIPITGQGGMTINAVSVNDLQIFSSLESHNIFPNNNGTFIFRNGEYQCTFTVTAGNYSLTGILNNGLRVFAAISDEFDIEYAGVYNCDINGDLNSVGGPVIFQLHNLTDNTVYPMNQAHSLTKGTYRLEAMFPWAFPEGADLGDIRFKPLIRKVSQEVI